MREQPSTPNLIDDAQQLIQAAKNGHLQDIIAIQNRHTDSNFISIIASSDNYGYTALIKAAENGHTEIVQHLLNALRDDCADTTIKHRDNDDGTALIQPSQNDHKRHSVLGKLSKEELEWLLNTLCDPEKATNLLKTLKIDTHQRALNHRNTDGDTALIKAAENGHTEIVQHLLNALHNAEVDVPAALNHANNNGITALIWASNNGHTKIVQHLLNALRNANANIIEAINQKDTDGDTALICASENGHIEIVQHLLNALQDTNADIIKAINQQTDGDTALIKAAENGHTDIVQHLLNALRNANADIIEAIKHRNNSGSTALMQASENGHIKVVKHLLNALRDAWTDTTIKNRDNDYEDQTLLGLDKLRNTLNRTTKIIEREMHRTARAINDQDPEGITALMFASQNGHTEIIQLLLNTLRDANADILAAINQANNDGITALMYASDHCQTETGKLLLAHGAHLANAEPQDIASLIALNYNPPIPEDKLLAILQNDDISWVIADYADFSNKSRNEQNALSALASWGVIVGNQSFVTDMISVRQDTLSLAEHTEYLRLALQAQKLEVAEILLEHVQEHDPEHTNNRQSVLNYLLHLMVVERGSLCAINFLLAQGASPKIYIREENSTLVTHTLFKQHSAYQIKKIYRKMSNACRQKLKPETLTQQNFLGRFITVVKEEETSPSPEGIHPKNICTRLQAYFNKQTLYHLAAYDNRPSVLTAIKRNIAARSDRDSEERPAKRLRR